jgi:hypothetical protein
MDLKLDIKKLSPQRPVWEQVISRLLREWLVDL